MAAPARTRKSKVQLHAQPRPGGEPYKPHLEYRHLLFSVFTFKVYVLTDDAQFEESFDTDGTWDAFRTMVTRHLENTPKPLRLGWKVKGDSGKPVSLTTEKEFLSAMDDIHGRIDRSYRKPVDLEVCNLVSRM